MIILLKLLPVMIGILCIVTACIPERSSIKQPVFTEGEVIGSVSQKRFQKHSEAIFLAPVIRYQTEQGEQTAAARNFVPEWQYHYREGDKLRICYDKSAPGIFGILNGSGYRFRRVLCLTAGISILTAYGILWIQYY